MSKYRLVQESKEVDFNVIPDFNDLNNNRLEDIIKFTGVFKNEDELRNYLKHYKLINTDKPLKIKYRYAHKDKTLIHGITYRDDIKFINVRNIESFLVNNRYNTNFLDNLCRHYRNSYNNNGNIFAIRNYICVLNEKQEAMDDARQIVYEFDAAILDFVKKECYKYDSKTGKYNISFKNLRDLGMFLSLQTKRDETLNISSMDNTDDITEYISSKNISVEETKEIVKPHVKVKTKNNYNGQMTFKVDQNGNLTY